MTRHEESRQYLSSFNWQWLQISSKGMERKHVLSKEKKIQDVRWVIIGVRSISDLFTSSAFLILEGGPGLCTPQGWLCCTSSQNRDALKVNTSVWLTNIYPHMSRSYSIWEEFLFFNCREISIRIYKKKKADSVCLNCRARSSFVHHVLRAVSEHTLLCVHTHIQRCYLCIVRFPSFFLVSANTVIFIILDMSGALQLRALNCLFWLRS